MTVNSIYDTPKVLQDYVLHQKGISSVPRTGAQITARREALEALRSKWASIVDGSTFGQLNDLIGIRLAGNGRLVVTYQADHTYSDGSLIAIPYRFVTKAHVERFLSDYIGWLDVQVDEHQGRASSITIKPAQGTSNLRVRAFAQAVTEAHEQLGTIIDASSVVTGNRPTLVIRGRETYVDGNYVTGVQLHQLYWPLAIAKEIRDNLTELMRSALRVQRQQSEAVVIKRDTSASFEVFMDRRQKAMRALSTKKSIENLPIIEPADMETPRTWGIEIEAAGARNVEAPASDWERKGDGSLRSAYGNGDRDPLSCPYHNHDEDSDDPDEVEDCEWLNEEDWESNDDGWGGGGDTAEFVSPILNTAGSPELKSLLAELANEPQNDSAGVHVHVDAADLTPRNIGGLVFAYSVIEPIIEKAYFRTRRNYCKERPAPDVLQVIKSSKTPGIRKSYRDGSDSTGGTMYYGERYSSVNLNALEAHGTVEFRAMGPVYRYDHLIKWALFVREMVSIARLNLPPKVWTSVKNWNDLEKLLYKYGTELPADRLRKMEAELAVKSTTRAEVELVNA